MALRNYLYAKHSDPFQRALINKDPASAPESAPQFKKRAPKHKHISLADNVRDSECSSDRKIVLEDGSTKCANCADCPKKTMPMQDGNPKVKVQVDGSVSEMKDKEVDYTSAF
ncbi:hypothetical protein E0198_003044 [Clavispora lusitaniae]|nr:hypothetical protein E0198_003044 [Clavispora lusitaniae]